MFEFSIPGLFSELTDCVSNLLDGDDLAPIPTLSVGSVDDLLGDVASCHSTNPATGLPMICGDCGVDVGGNSYGFSDNGLFD